MNDLDRPGADLEARLRRLHSRLDTSAGFEARLLLSVAASGAALAPAERARLRSRLALEQLATRARLRRRLYLALAAAAGVGAGVAWLAGAVLGRALAAFAALPSVVRLAAYDPGGGGGYAVVLLVAGWLWMVVRASARGDGIGPALVR